MTPDQITAIERSFTLITAIAEPAAAIFYRKLFERDPALRPLFHTTDFAAQGRKLMQAIGFVVANLRKPEAMLGAVAAMGRRHGGYGVRPGDYATVGAALLDTLSEGLGPEFNPELRQAWTSAYGLVAATMIGAAGAAAPRDPCALPPPAAADAMMGAAA